MKQDIKIIEELTFQVSRNLSLASRRAAKRRVACMNASQILEWCLK